MFRNIRNGWKMGKAVRRIVMQDKSLMFYPIVAVILSIISFLIVFGIGLISAFIISGSDISKSSFFAIIIFSIFIAYISIEFVSIYVNIALLIAFKHFIKKKKIKMKDSFKETKKYGKNILKWAIFYSVLIMILNAIESEFGGITRIIIGFIGSLAISAATFFVVPVILEENIGPISAMKESINIIYHKFGQTFGGIAFIDLYSFIFVIIGIAIIFSSIILLSSVFAILLISIIIGIIFLIYGLIYGATLKNIFKLIIYDYANGKQLPKEINEQTLLNSIIKKGKKNNNI